ncbi:hypothetical protein LBMAG53_02300 [Planctomycetota bacterium]|nr:hypothetical protein LBMAG53_02300 [Planctomycetota bacterium]
MRPYYPTSLAPHLTDGVFAAPPAEYRGVPFWSWNGKLDRQQLLQQMDEQVIMGMGAFQPHSRIGLETPYLGAEWFGHVQAVVAKAKADGNRVWIYDEDRWPSGYAGGFATKDPKNRAQFLRFTRQAEAPSAEVQAKMWAWTRRDGSGKLVARFVITQDGDGRITSSRRLADGEPATADTWYAYHEISGGSPWFNGSAYLNTIDAASTKGFLATTHEQYAARLDGALGDTVAAFFTDEPSITPFARLPSATAPADAGDGIVTWNGDLVETFAKAHGFALLDRLPEIFLDRADGAHTELRWRFHDHLADRFRNGYHRVLGDWCAAHGVANSGHLMAEDTLYDQHRFLGEAMRHYRHYHIPGIDNLCDLFQPLTAKQAQSVARQDGRAGVMSELYGVTDWPFTAAGHKRQGDWQAALGITVRVHHLAWFTMAGHAKRDYPASIDSRLPWWREYSFVEDHFARVNALLTRGRPVCRVAVVHPIESQWVISGPAASSRAAQGDLEAVFQQITKDLLHGLIDADFVAESILPEQHAASADGLLHVGAMAYSAVVLPSLVTIRSSTLDRLEAFAAGGGRIVVVGGLPALVDGKPSDRAKRLKSLVIPVSKARLLEALEDQRDLALITADGLGISDCLYQLRQDGDERHLFLCSTKQGRAGIPTWPWDRKPSSCIVRLRGTWEVIHNDTQAGERQALPFRHADGWTEVAWEAQAAASLCLTLRPAATAQTTALPSAQRWNRHAVVADPIAVELAEPNVVTLSLAESRVDGGAWLRRQEIGQAENLLRQSVGLPARRGDRRQPWTLPKSTPKHRAELRFVIDAAVPVRGARLAVEGAPTITLDGAALTTPANGWWIDPCLSTRPLPDLTAGRHELVLGYPLVDEGTLEWAYLLGDFGVTASGTTAQVIAPASRYTWGDLGRQGLPFYGGNVVYRCRITAPGGPLRLAVPWFDAPLLAVELDGRRVGRIAYEPYRLDLGSVSPGEHELAITAFGHRRNHLGALHCRQPGLLWWGPDTYERTDDTGVDEWQLVPTGIATAPFLEVPA